MDKRTTLALLLMAALLMVYQLLMPIFMPEPPPEQKPGVKTETPLSPSPTPSAPATGPVATATTPPPSPKDAPAVPERIAVIETPLYHAAVATTGGQVKAWDLHFRGEKPMVLPGTLDNGGWVVRRPGQPPRPIAFSLSTESIKLDKNTPTGELCMVGEDGFGIRVIQVLRFHADTYVVEHELKVENRHTVAQAVELVVVARPSAARRPFPALVEDMRRLAENLARMVRAAEAQA